MLMGIFWLTVKFSEKTYGLGWTNDFLNIGGDSQFIQVCSEIYPFLKLQELLFYNHSFSGPITDVHFHSLERSFCSLQILHFNGSTRPLFIHILLMRQWIVNQLYNY